MKNAKTLSMLVILAAHLYAWPGFAAEAGPTLAELAARLETVQTKRAALVSEFKLSQALIENLRFQDRDLKAEEDVLLAKIAALKAKNKREEKKPEPEK